MKILKISVVYPPYILIGMFVFCPSFEFVINSSTQSIKSTFCTKTYDNLFKKEWKKGSVKPNEKATIKVVYDAKHLGTFNKVIWVFYNGPNSPKKLNIKGKVAYPEDLIE